ncbi:MAG TPA: PASTA domain-containing protein [Micromonosporaceae bacterium]|jgi:beta-lactam-binding protein with PASTA domain|nr:PASTA domain-containing protein [Micromonosporaceae bacterium]
MATKWVITTATERITLDDAMHGETTFTVTNPGRGPDRAVFEVVPGEGADSAWFSVDEPQRRVPGSGSVSYVMKVALPPGAKPGSYTVQGRVYSADSAPEESSVLSGRLAVEVVGAAAPVPKRRPWWLLAVAALVVIVLAVVGWLVFRKEGPAPTVAPGQVSVPDLSRQSLGQATTNLDVFGLKVGTVLHQQNPAAGDAVLFQSVAPGAKVAKGTPVDLVVSVNMSAPALTAPGNGAAVPRAAFTRTLSPLPTRAGPSAALASPSAALASPSAPLGVLRWTQKEPYVKRWMVTVQYETCTLIVVPFFPAQNLCGFVGPISTVVTTTSATPLLGFTPQPGANVPFNTGNVQWQVVALDDFGNAGTPSPWLSFTAR